MNFIKAINEGYFPHPSDEVLAKSIVEFSKKYPNSPIVHSVCNIFQTDRSDVTDYDILYHKIHNPVNRYGSGLRKGDFINDYYQKIKMYISPDMDMLEDLFLGWEGVKISIAPVGDSYKVNVIGLRKPDIPDAYRKIINVINNRVPSGYIIGEVIYKMSLNTISVMFNRF